MLSHAWEQVPTFSRFSALPVAFKLKKSEFEKRGKPERK